MMRVTKAPPVELAELLIELGPRRLVLVEGDTDLAAFNEWFLEREADLLFHVPSGGGAGVRAFLQQALAASSTRRVYGIIDRDFCTDAQVEACLADEASHLFILHRYCLENYLLEPDAIREELRVYYGAKFVVPNVNAIQSDLLQMCRNLGLAMAANWTLLEGAGAYLPIGFDTDNRAAVVQHTAAQLDLDRVEAEQRIAVKEAQLAPKMNTLENAHTCVNGKFLLNRVYAHYISAVQRGLVGEHLFNLLVRTTKRQGVHADIRTIIKDRILK